MPDSLPTVWDINPHTEKKHEILRRYLDQWLPILGQTRGRIVYLDGFAGPGVYSKGEPGSPLIAIDCATRHILAGKFRAELIFYFIEADHARAENLRKVLADRYPPALLAERRIKYSITEARFAEELSGILTSMEQENRQLAPTFAFLDPFGFSGLPMRLIARLLRYDACEVLITFMEGFVNRFADQSLAPTMDELFGDDVWRQGLALEEPSAREAFWLNTYQKKLAEIGGAPLVRSFGMVNKFNQTEYFLVYGTKHWKGMQAMKEAMWKVDKTGQYQFSDLTDPSQTLLLDFESEPTWGPLAREEVWNHLRGRIVSEESIRKFIVTDTRYVYRKKPILWGLEDEGRIVGRSKRHSFPDGCLVKFKA